MKKIIIFVLALVFVIGLESCRDKRVGESEDDIFKAKDYAMSVFEDTMPENYTIVAAKGSVGEKRKDSIYEITFTYTIGEDDEKFSHWYKVSVEESGCVILEDEPRD